MFQVSLLKVIKERNGWDRIRLSLLTLLYMYKYIYFIVIILIYIIAVTSYYRTSHEILISCVLSISVLTIISSSVATVISVGFPREKLEFLRHYSVFNIVSCESIIGYLCLTCSIYTIIHYTVVLFTV